MGYEEVLRLCQEALTLLKENGPLQAQAPNPGSSPTVTNVSKGGLSDPAGSQPIDDFLSETDRLLSEVAILLRKYEAMKEVEDMNLDTLADSIHAFTSATQEKLNRG